MQKCWIKVTIVRSTKRRNVNFRPPLTSKRQAVQTFTAMAPNTFTVKLCGLRYCQKYSLSLSLSLYQIKERDPEKEAPFHLLSTYHFLYSFPFKVSERKQKFPIPPTNIQKIRLEIPLSLRYAQKDCNWSYLTFSSKWLAVCSRTIGFVD